MLDHSDFHCRNFKYSCPMTCYRAQLTSELLSFDRYSGIALWKNFGKTAECPLWENPRTVYYRQHREKAQSYYQRTKKARLAYGKAYYDANKYHIKKQRILKNTERKGVDP